MIRPGFALLLLAMLWLGASPVRAQDTIWGAVLLASNAAQPSETPPELRGLAERLGRIFGYNQWVVLGSSTEKIDDQVERMLIPTKHFSLNVKARRASSKEARGGYLLNLTLFQDKRQIVDTYAKLAPESPLFIRGPMHARGQLVIALKVQP
jgi:hypothetical protein